MYVRLDINPINVDADGIAESQTTAGAANLVLNGALADLGTAGVFDIGDAGYSSGIAGVQIAIVSVGDVSSVIFTVTGTNQDGVATTETITNVTTTPVESNTYWNTITQISTSAAVGSAVTVGPVDEIITKTIPLNWRCPNVAGVAVTNVVGTLQYDIDRSISDINDLGNMLWSTSQNNQTGILVANLLQNATAVRLKFDSYTSGAELQFEVRQKDNAS